MLLKTKINRFEKTTFEVTVTLILKIKFEYLRFKFKVVLYRKRDQKILFKYVEEKSRQWIESEGFIQNGYYGIDANTGRSFTKQDMTFKQE